MAALGEEFRRAREARGQTISDVAERLHIRSVYLTAIEDEDWAAIGAPVYIRGFMRTYARYLGLDPEAAVARLSEAPAPTERRAAAGPPVVTTEERTGRRLPSAGALLAVLIAVALVGVVAYQYGQYRLQGQAPPVAAVSPTATPAAEAAAPEVSAGEEEGASPAAALPGGEPPVVEPAPVASAAQLGLRLTETSWLRVVVDGKVALEGTFPPGTVKTFTGKVATVRIGNAGGVDIAVDGRPVGKLGADGDVVERRFTLAGE